MDNPTNQSQNDFSGVWQSKYTFHSSSQDAELVNYQYVRILQEGDTIVVESIPEANESYIIARFNVDGRVVTGVWQDTALPDSYHKGVTYHGVGQLILSEDGKSMTGKWLGHGKNLDVKVGPWEISWIAETADGLGKAPGVQPLA